MAFAKQDGRNRAAICTVGEDGPAHILSLVRVPDVTPERGNDGVSDGWSPLPER